MTEQERRRKLEEIKESARRTDELHARNELAADLAVARLKQVVHRLLAAR